MRLVSWNVNGLRAVLKKDFEQSFNALNADVFCLQETKCQEGQVNINFSGFSSYFSYADKKGYSGTAVFTKQQPLKIVNRLFSDEECSADSEIDKVDHEGRLCALEFDKYWLVCVYTPNAQNDLVRIGPRIKWGTRFTEFCKSLENVDSGQTKPVVICGDLNVAHKEIDLKNPGPNRGKAGFSDEERQDFSKLLDSGFVDTFRLLNPDLEGAYSWWSYRFNSRARNAGWRIDYFLLSEFCKNNIIDAQIHAEVMGSDHCPVSLDIEF